MYDALDFQQDHFVDLLLKMRVWFAYINCDQRFCKIISLCFQNKFMQLVQET